MSIEVMDIVVPGQSDALDNQTDSRVHAHQELHSDPQQRQSFIDDDNALLRWSDEDEDEDEEGDEGAEGIGSEGGEDADEWDNDVLTNVDHEDWEIAERDFTKRYNRLRQHVAVRMGETHLSSATSQSSNSVPNSNRAVPLPALNRPRGVPTSVTLQNFSDRLAALSIYSSRISKIDQPYHMMGIATDRKALSERANSNDKSDRATNEQVLDPRTRIILFKMIGRGLIGEINGCVSTGKEANVYHAFAPDKTHIAVKIFKTSILIFKDRDRYVSGERRFRRGYSKHNPRKMVRLWAEKEMRNLKRLVAAGIPCPTPVEVRENVLLMEFLGNKFGWASPRLKDADIPESQLIQLYKALLLIVRRMFHLCKLVHADLSEYNILYHNSRLYIIDVGQSVEHDHPSAFDFLRSDLKNVEEFFNRRGVPCIGTRRAFEFVIQEFTESSEMDAKTSLDKLIAESERVENEEKEDSQYMEHEKKTNEKVFMQSYIPRTLNEAYDPARGVDLIKYGDEGLIYSDVLGLVGTTIGTKKVRITEPTEPLHEGKESSEDETEGRGSEENNHIDGDNPSPKQPRGHRNEDKEAKKERKKAVKEAAREKRKHKIPKANKKRLIKATRS